MGTSKHFGHTLAKLGLAILATVFCALPIEIYIGFRYLAQPQGFWQELALGVAGLFFLGSLQIILFLVWGWLLAQIADM